ncbi:anti-sigma factor domain-containing protein [Janibacter sp. GXQ6167]|uniref:anti-sigma factor domain-containing protein n=1 Tax=Janibacter sp. GXQ6167 TaxID=3240791 RepID=UPI0035251EB6
MMHPEPEALAGYALGENSEEEIARHVGECAQCRAEVAEIAGIAAALSGGPTSLTPPPDQVWTRIVDNTDTTDQRAASLPERPAHSPFVEREGDTGSGPNLSEGRKKRSPSRTRLVLPWAAAAAAAGLLIGGGTVALVNHNEPTTTVVKQANLDTLDTNVAKGEADLVRTGSSLTLKVTTEPMDAPDGYLAVWLINKDQQRMVSIGVLPPGATEQTFEVSQTLIDAGYVIVDISDEPFDDNPAHSGKTLARGVLA